MPASTTTASFITEGFALPFLCSQRPAAVVPAGVIILLHGVGSNEQDMFTLGKQLPGNFLLVAPRGPYTLGSGRYSWYQVDFSTGRPVIDMEQELQSRKLLTVFIQQIRSAYGMGTVYLGGFSQGAVMSYGTGLTNPALIKGIMALSGRITPAIKPLVKKDAALQQLQLFIAHGVQDTVLPVTDGREARDYLQALGISVSYHEYAMGHQVNQQVINVMGKWLTTIAVAG